MALQNITLNQGQHVTVTAAPLDQNGNASNPPNGVPVWACSEPTVTLAPAADGMSALVTVGTKPGVFQVNVTGSVIAFGPNFTSSFDVTVNKGNPASFLFSFTSIG